MFSVDITITENTPIQLDVYHQPTPQTYTHIGQAYIATVKDLAYPVTAIMMAWLRKN